MTGEAAKPLLSANDPPPVRVTNADGGSLFLLLGDHAGNLVPETLGNLGLSETELGRHIALDIGVSALGAALSEMLDAPFVEQRYSRLVIDCNRNTAAPDSSAPVSDGTAVPANAALDPAGRQRRISEIFQPYHEAIAKRLDARRETVVVALHSFTPSLGGQARPWEIGVLHDGGDPRFALCFLGEISRSGQINVGDNRPYTMDETDYTVPRHAYPKRRAYVEIEVRQDCLGTPQGVAEMARIIADSLLRAATAH